MSKPTTAGVTVKVDHYRLSAAITSLGSTRSRGRARPAPASIRGGSKVSGAYIEKYRPCINCIFCHTFYTFFAYFACRVYIFLHILPIFCIFCIYFAYFLQIVHIFCKLCIFSACCAYFLHKFGTKLHKKRKVCRKAASLQRPSRKAAGLSRPGPRRL